MPRRLSEAEKRRRAGFQANAANTGVTSSNSAAASRQREHFGREVRDQAISDRQRAHFGREVRDQAASDAERAKEKRDPRLDGHPSNARFVSRDGRVSYNSRGQRLDSNGNVAFRTSRSPRRGRSGSAADERTTGLKATSGEEGGVQADQGAATAALQLPWLAFQQQQAAAGGANASIAQQAGAATQAIAQGQGGAVNGNQFATLGLPGPGANPQIWQGLTPQQQQAALNYYNTVLPFAQFNQNAFQYQNDFSEAQRRFQLELAQRRQESAFSAAGRASLPSRRFI